ncbi:MAG TPA: hypothetical protein VH741_12245 [Candidatus Limnocylindrales bacterium]
MLNRLGLVAAALTLCLVGGCAGPGPSGSPAATPSATPPSSPSPSPSASASASAEFTRKVVVLAPGFGSALAERFEIFGRPTACATPADPQSLREALICLGYRSDEGESELAGATIVDMAWEKAPCVEPSTEQPDPPADCVATIAHSADGSDVIWRPAEYDISDAGLSMLRQQQIELWGHRLAETMVTYDRELRAAAGYGASFYLVGHSMGGQLVVRTLRAILDDADLAAGFEGPNRGRLARVISIDGAINWTGTVGEREPGDPCPGGVRTVANEQRERDNVAAVEAAFDRLGTLTVAVTSATDVLVSPQVALLREPARPARGYVDEVFHEDGASEACTHSTLLLPEPSGYPLLAILAEHLGPATPE